MSSNEKRHSCRPGVTVLEGAAGRTESIVGRAQSVVGEGGAGDSHRRARRSSTAAHRATIARKAEPALSAVGPVFACGGHSHVEQRWTHPCSRRRKGRAMDPSRAIPVLFSRRQEASVVAMRRSEASSMRPSPPVASTGVESAAAVELGGIGGGSRQQRWRR
jgi:hypothetical protein